MTTFVGNTNILDLVGLKSAVEDTYVNDATVTVTVVDSAGTNVTGQSWPATMAYVATSNGNYRCALSNDLALLANKTYRAMIDVDAGIDRQGHYEFPFTPKTRTKS